MSHTGNKGDWSEIYAFFKLLAEGKVYSADGKLNKIENLFYIISEIIRLENKSEEYTYSITHNNIRIAGNCEEFSVSRERFSEIAKQLYESIITSHPTKGESLSFPKVEEFMNEVKCFSLKASSANKADIRMIIHDTRTCMEHQLGFSIKSKLGGKSTLFNSNKDTTNFLYRIEGLNQKQVAEFNSKKRFSDKFKILYDNGGYIKFDSIVNDTFRNNILYIDCCLQTILGSCLIQYYSHSGHSVADVIDEVTKINPCGFPDTMDFYAHKMKQMLLTFALGMTSAKIWTGRYDANGGYLVVKEDGDVVCYHFYDLNDLEDYLFYNTHFDTPSTTRHQFGNIYEENGKLWLKLNLQIRFLH